MPINIMCVEGGHALDIDSCIPKLSKIYWRVSYMLSQLGVFVHTQQNHLSNLLQNNCVFFVNVVDRCGGSLTHHCRRTQTERCDTVKIQFTSP